MSIAETIAGLGVPPLSGIAIGCAVLCYLMIWPMMPLFRRYALARPNARSSHSVPTPQGGGTAVLMATAAGLLVLAAVMPDSPLRTSRYAAMAAGSLLLAATGALDDMFELPVVPRLVAQFGAAGLGLYAVFGNVWGLFASGALAGSTGSMLLLMLPLLLIGLVWFINLTNFMDGIDGITVAEFVPICGALAVFAELGAIPLGDGLIAAALLGALAGFSPYNRHVARLFLGDVGSLFIGFIAGVLLLALAADGGVAAALILPLYYLADATFTLVRRLIRGEIITQAHRTHIYQRATDIGWSVPAITGRLWLLNSALGVLAIGSLWLSSPVGQALCLCLAAGLVAWVLLAFSKAPAQ